MPASWQNGDPIMKENKKDIAIALASVALAIFLWNFVMGSTNPVINREYRNIPVEIINEDTVQANNMILIQPKNPTINVTLQGKRNEINRVQPSDIIAQVDLARYGSQTQSIPVSVDPPPDTTVFALSQNAIVFKFEKLVDKEIPVTVQTLEKLPSNHIMLMGTQVKPERVTIRGASSIVNKIQSAQAVIDLQTITEDKTLNVPITLLDSEGNQVVGVEIEQKEVSVSVSINGVKEVPMEVVTTGTLGEGIEISTPTLNQAEVSITGDSDILKDIEKIQTKPIDLSGIHSTSNVNAELDLPRDVFLTHPDKQILVNIEVISDKSRTFNLSKDDVELRNLINGKKGRILLDTPISITIKGSSANVDRVESLKPYIDLSTQDLGNHTMQIKVEPVEGVIIDKVEPGDVEVEITD